jgi:hypothetical protein
MMQFIFKKATKENNHDTPTIFRPVYMFYTHTAGYCTAAKEQTINMMLLLQESYRELLLL